MSETTEQTPTTLDINPRIKALMQMMECEADEIEEARYGDNTFTYGRQEFLVLTDAEADEKCAESIKETLWAFNVSFLTGYVPALRGNRVEKAWEKVVSELCEDANPLVEALLGDRMDDFVQDAIGADGRGHFLSSYDGHENDESVDGTTYYIYRTN